MLAIKRFHTAYAFPLCYNIINTRPVEAIAMKTKLLIWFSLCFPAWLIGQDSQLDVRAFPTNPDAQHIHLNLRIPSGEVFMKASPSCGNSYFKVFSDDSSLNPHIEDGLDAHGNWLRTLSLDVNQKSANGQVSAQHAAANSPSDFNNQVFLNNSGNATVFRSTYSPDPALSTDLYLDLGIGRSRLDFSDLSLNRVKIHSAFSDLHITYTQANRVQMEKMDIHVAKAKIVLKNIQQARAEVVSIVNDMGDTKMVIGKEQYNGSTIYVQQGMGDLLLIVHPDQPTKIILKNGLFSSISVPDGPDGFTSTSEGGKTYTNKAYTKSGGKNATTVICTIDFGGISVYTGR